MLYQHELTGAPLAELADAASTFTVPVCPEGADDYDLVPMPLSDYARELVAGVAGALPEVDEAIVQTSQNWALDRMPVVDRNIIRVAVYEVVHRDEIPAGVAINEAVEAAKLYGGDDSPKFVNGVLGRIAAACGGTDGASDEADGADGGAAGEAGAAAEDGEARAASEGTGAGDDGRDAGAPAAKTEG